MKWSWIFIVGTSTGDKLTLLLNWLANPKSTNIRILFQLQIFNFKNVWDFSGQDRKLKRAKLICVSIIMVELCSCVTLSAVVVYDPEPRGLVCVLLRQNYVAFCSCHSIHRVVCASWLLLLMTKWVVEILTWNLGAVLCWWFLLWFVVVQRIVLSRLCLKAWDLQEFI